MGMAFALPLFHGEVEIDSVKLSDSLLVFFNFLLAVFTAALWWSTRTLWRVTRDIADHQAKDTRILQRAYISTRGSDIEQIGTGDLMGHVFIRNVGKLPATNIRWFIDMTASDDPDWRPPSLGSSILAPVGILSIDCEMVRGGPGRPNSALLYWYLWGLITYENGFGEQCFTQFCHRYHTNTRQTPTGGGYILPASRSRQHEQGNEAT